MLKGFSNVYVNIAKFLNNCTELIVKDVKPRYKYDDSGKRTNTIEGTTITVVVMGEVEDVPVSNFMESFTVNVMDDNDFKVAPKQQIKITKVAEVSLYGKFHNQLSIKTIHDGIQIVK
ncbi:MAG: hypothetical protein IAA89_06155 [Firmicutes bacterium]|uniref:Uncharacterized protein n=1 Tax=Candidatus Gallilactobacillus intestinavium TaxID=2840838 RepID=A0A9D9E6C3_9LACO|nr:hypothetical protein [Candidatus Gallilactobacillus intestinavium]